VVRQVAHAYRRRGVGAIVVTNRWPRDLPEFEEYQSIPTYRIPMRVPTGAMKARLNYFLTHRSIYRGLLRILRRHECDVIHVHCVSDNGYYARRAARDLKLPLVVTAHGELTMDATKLYERSEFARTNLRAVLDAADEITACAGKALADVQTFYGRPLGTRARVVYNGTNPADFTSAAAYQNARPYVLAMGRMVPQKGFDVLLKAWAELKLESHDLLLAGDGDERASLEKLAGDLGLSGRVRFLGRVDRAGAAGLLKSAEMFVLPSRADEGLPMVCLETMTAGKPIVASRVGGVPEFVEHEKNGLLVPREDVARLAAAISRLLGDGDLRARLGAAGQVRVADFTWDAIAAQYEQVYAAAAKAHRIEAFPRNVNQGLPVIQQQQST